MSVLVNHAIKCIESPFKSTVVLPSHGASTGYSCKDLGCEGIYNQFIPTNQWNKNHSVKNTAFPPKHTLLFFLHTHQCAPCVHEAQPVSETQLLMCHLHSSPSSEHPSVGIFAIFSKQCGISVWVFPIRGKQQHLEIKSKPQP